VSIITLITLLLAEAVSMTGLSRRHFVHLACSSYDRNHFLYLKTWLQAICCSVTGKDHILDLAPLRFPPPLRSLHSRRSNTMPRHERSTSRCEAPSVAHQLPTDTRQSNPDLTATVVDTWPALPEAIKAGILAMIKAARS
jgi:hypothetical protein